MALTTRQINNSLTPILAGVIVTFELVDSLGSPTSTFDAQTGEAVSGMVTATADAGGVFSAALWPNDRGAKPTLYKCTLGAPVNDSFMGTMPSGNGAVSLFQFKEMVFGFTDDEQSALTLHEDSVNNPHNVTKAQVGLGNVDNTSDANKPISIAQAEVNALDTAHRGSTDNPHSVTKAQVGLGNVDNTADMDKPVSTAQAAAIGLKVGVDNLGAAGAAGVIGFTPVGGLVAENVQAALAELDTEKEPAANKSTTLIADLASNLKFPSVKAVYDWVVSAFVARTSPTGSAQMPSGSTGQRDGEVGALRHNLTTDSFEGKLASGWAPVGITVNAPRFTGFNINASGELVLDYFDTSDVGTVDVSQYAQWDVTPYTSFSIVNNNLSMVV